LYKDLKPNNRKYLNKRSEGVLICMLLIFSVFASISHILSQGTSFASAQKDISTKLILLSSSLQIPVDKSLSSNNHTKYDVILPQGDGASGARNTFFIPTSLHIHTGDTVRWINKDTVSHTVTSVAFNSGPIWPEVSKQGSSVYSHTFDQSGTYVYFCQIHPYMSGIVYVDTQESQRELRFNNPSNSIMDVKIEIPQNAAYGPNFGPMFIPSGAHIPFGSKITWTNKDYVPHTATALDGTFDTGIISPGQSKSVILNERSGTIDYYCKYHPWMQGLLMVDEPT